MRRLFSEFSWDYLINLPPADFLAVLVIVAGAIFLVFALVYLVFGDG